MRRPVSRSFIRFSFNYDPSGNDAIKMSEKEFTDQVPRHLNYILPYIK
jgi:hypothetical protein